MWRQAPGLIQPISRVPMGFPMFGLRRPAEGQDRFMLRKDEGVELPVFVAFLDERLLEF